jgi:RHS repeat-associated protein
LSDTLLLGIAYTGTYDSLDRVTSLASSANTTNLTYDANGNRLTQSGSSAVTYTTSSTSNRLSSTSGALARSYAYDAAGNTQSYTGVTFLFNQRGRMSSATTAAGTTNYIYNALGQLIEKSGAGGTTLLAYDESGHLLGEYSNTGVLIQETVWMGDTPVATLRPNGSAVSIYYVHTDHLNAPRVVTQSTDNAVRWLWGGNAANQNPLNLGTFVYNLRYPGQYYQAETGLHYNTYRDYDPSVGRYVESDPIGLTGGINTYMYANGNPLSLSDILGLACRKGERILRNELFKDLSRTRELGKREFPFIGAVHADIGVSPELGPKGIRLRVGPSLSWGIIYFVFEQDEISEGYVHSKFFSRKYYCKSDDPCSTKEWVEIRDDGEFEQNSFLAVHDEWKYIGAVPSGYTIAMP